MTSIAPRFNKRGRGGPHTGTGYSSRGGGKDHYAPHPVSSPMSPSSLPGVYANPDMAYALVAIVGCVVDVQLKSGDVYRGILKAVSPQLTIALALAHNRSKELTEENMERFMQLEFADVVTVSALSDSNPSATNIFKTDTEISRTNGSGYAKELQRFSFDDDNEAAIAVMDQSSGWSAEDMFETNRSKFNVESSYNEEMTEYTTKLERSGTKDYYLREQRAEKLAQEIEESVNKHGINDTGTEEEMFSAVVRQEVATPPPGVSKPKHTAPSSHPSSRPPFTSTGGTTRMVTEGHSYSAVAESTLELRLPGKGADSANANSSHSHLGTNSSLSQTSSQELHTVQGTDMDSMNPKGGWPSQEESGLSLSGGENSYLEKGQVSATLEEGSQESLGPEDEEREGQEGQEEVDLVGEETVQVARDVAAQVGQKQGMAEMVSVPPGLGIDAKTKVKNSDSKEKEEKVRKFQLDPNAKTFRFNAGAKEFVPSSFTPPSNTSPLTQSASSPSVLESSSYNPPPQYNPVAKKYPKRIHNNHSATATTAQYVPTDSMGYMPPTANYVFSSMHPSLVRNPMQQQQQQQVAGQQMIQYSSSVPQFVPSYPPAAGGNFIGQSQALVAPQHMVNNGQKYEVNPVFAGNQYSTVAHQLMQQQQLMAVSQQLSTGSAGGLVTTPPVMVVQGGQMGYQQMTPMAAQPQMLGQSRYIQQPPPN